MRLKSKSVTLVALLVLTAMPRALDQLSDLGNMAEERFRTELLNIFWNLTAPETRRGGPQSYSELLARTASNSPRCGRSVEAKTTRAARAFNSFTPATQTTGTALEHLQPWGTDATPTANSIAEALPAPAWVWELPAAAEHAPAAHQTIAPPDKPDVKVVLVAENQKGHALFDEAALPARIEDAIAELELNQDETAEAPKAKAVAVPKSEVRAERFGQKFVQTNFQIRLPENLGPLTSEKFVNSSTIIKVREALQQAKPKCRVRVIRLAPDTAPPLADKPATIS